MSDLKTIIRQAFWIYLFGYLAAPLGYLIRIIYARQFSLEEFGLIYSIIGLLTVISIFNDLGFTETMSYYSTRFFEKKQYGKVKGSMIFAMIMQVGTAILIAGALYFLAPILADAYFKTEIANLTLRWFLLYLIFYNLTMPVIQLFMVTHHYYYQNLAEAIRLGFITIMALMMLWLPSLKTTVFVAMSWSIGFAAVLVVLIPLMIKKHSKILQAKADLSFSLYKKLLKYSALVVVGTGASIILSRVDIIVLTYFKDLKEVGYYSGALSLAMIILLAIGPILAMIFPLTSKLNVRKEKKKIESMIRGTYIIGLFLVMPMLVVFLAYPMEIINLFFGESFLPGKIVLMVLSVGYFVNVFGTFNFYVIAGLGMVKTRVKIMYLGAAINLIADIILVNTYGKEGIAIATTFSLILMMALSFITLLRHLKFEIDYIAILKIVASNALLLIIASYLKNRIEANLFIEAAIIGSVMIIVYAAIGYFWKIIDYKQTIKLFINNIR
ncbi:flippase [Candidatus Woesearchaeota archaeon]|nr:flippase [Candidatus Woesearchaeota archaeon]